MNKQRSYSGRTTISIDLETAELLNTARQLGVPVNVSAICRVAIKCEVLRLLSIAAPTGEAIKGMVLLGPAES